MFQWLKKSWALGRKSSYLCQIGLGNYGLKKSVKFFCYPLETCDMMSKIAILKYDIHNIFFLQVSDVQFLKNKKKLNEERTILNSTKCIIFK